MYQKILLPLNGSPLSEQAIPYALELCRLSGGTIVLSQVIPSPIVPPARYSLAEADAWLIRQEKMRQAAELYLSELVLRSDVAAADPRYFVLAGEVGESLLHLIDQEAVDVLVMTTRRRPKLARWVLGSTADYMVQHASVPVLLVRQDEAST